MTVALFAPRASAADLSFLDPQGPIAAAQRTHLIAIVALMMIVVLPVMILTPLFAWRYRYGNKSARYTPKWHFSVLFETLIWGVPTAIVVVMAIWLWQGTHRLDPYAALKSSRKPLKVDVIGYDWKWLFVYPQLHIASMGELVFPRHVPLDLRLTSDTVMQSFYIPALGSQIYAMAGMATKLHLVSDTTGQFRGENTQYDGMGFQDQKFIARATTRAGFRDWVRSVRAHGIGLTPKVYGAIRRRSSVEEARAALDPSGVPPRTLYFRSVPPDLFRNVVRSFHGGPSGNRVLIGAPASGAAIAALNDHRSGRTAARKG